MDDPLDDLLVDSGVIGDSAFAKVNSMTLWRVTPHHWNNAEAHGYWLAWLRAHGVQI